MKTKRPAFQFYPDAWLSSTDITLMTIAEEGAYHRLLCYAWQEEDCGLPDDDRQLAVLSKLGKAWPKSAETIRKKFIDRNGRLYNDRLLAERAKQDEWARKSSEGGRLSASRRAANRNHPSTTLEEWLQPKGNSPSSSPSLSLNNGGGDGNFTEADATENGTAAQTPPPLPEPEPTVPAPEAKPIHRAEHADGAPNHKGESRKPEALHPKATPPPSTASTVSEFLAEAESQSELAPVLTEIRMHFPAADLAITRRIVMAARAKVPDATELEIVHAIQRVRSRNQRSPALFVTTVPNVIESVRDELEQKKPRVIEEWLYASAERRAFMESEWPEFKDDWPKGDEALAS